MNNKINDDIFSVFPILETERLLLTEFLKSDAEELFKMRSDEEGVNDTTEKRPLLKSLKREF